MQQPLRQADRIRDRHQHDFAVDAPGRLGLVEQADQVMHHEHAGDLVGVQARLQVGLLAATRLAVVQAEQMTVGADRAGADRMRHALHPRTSSGAAGTSAVFVVRDAGPRRCASTRDSIARSAATSRNVNAR